MIAEVRRRGISSGGVVINRLHLLPRHRALLASDPAAVDLMAARPFPTADPTRFGSHDGVFCDALDHNYKLNGVLLVAESAGHLQQNLPDWLSPLHPSGPEGSEKFHSAFATTMARKRGMRMR
jgi:hypothetical protein